MPEELRHDGVNATGYRLATETTREFIARLGVQIRGDRGFPWKYRVRDRWQDATTRCTVLPNVL
jgi:hypothetical protein